MKDKENNKTQQKLTKAGKALSDRGLDLVSGGHVKVGGDILNSYRGKIIYCNLCNNEVARYGIREKCPVADGSICPACHQPITLSKCRIEHVDLHD